ncbi:ABC transporter substrate-binding protein [Gordonia sp. NPDC058843]|uniref:ABC transporter substrate-binding protein n=1 Tax=Gordonia sp. NPDC058843 TaxID=3346648 RepID=UPI0036BEF985
MSWKKLTAIAGTAAVAVGIAACGSGGSSGDAGSMQVMMFPSVAYRLPVIVAQEKGFFTDEGVTINVIAQPNNLQGIQALEATKSHAGLMGTSTFAQGIQAGSQVQAFCGGIDVTQSSIVAPAGSPLPSVSEGASPDEVFAAIKGRKVGAQTPVGSGFQVMLDGALAEGGATDLTWVNVGGSNSVTQASLQNGSVDVAQSSPSGTQQLVGTGSAKELIYLPDHSELYGQMYGSPWVGPTAWLRDNPDTAKGFCNATATALEYIKDPANRDEVRQISMKDSGITDEKVADAVLATYERGYSADLAADVIQRTFDKYVELGIVKPEPPLDASELVNTVGR